MTAGLLEEGRPALRDDIAALGDLADNLNASEPTLESFLVNWPGKLQTITRAGSYGSWFQFYLCGAGGSVGLEPFVPAFEIEAYTNTAARCGPDPDGSGDAAPEHAAAGLPLLGGS